MRKLTIEKMGDLAERKGGKCLSCVYVGNTVKLNWQCANGHQFLSKSNDVQQGHWCLQCYNKRRKRRIECNELHKFKVKTENKINFV